MSDQDTETELSKEERLEAARKKFEAMKKKKKKAGKKKTESDSKEGTPLTESETPELKEDARETKDSNASNDTGGLTENEKDEDELKGSEEKLKVTSNFDDPKSTSTENVDKNYLKLEEMADTTSPPEAKTAADTTTSQEASTATNISRDKPLASDNDPNTADVHQLRTLVENQKKTINKLRDENTDLKLEQLDLKDRITELEAELAKLQKGDNHVASSRPLIGSTDSAPTHVPVLPAKPIITSNDYALASQSDLSNKFEVVLDFRERLLLWKGWQVDMTNWNGVKGQPLLSL